MAGTLADRTITVPSIVSSYTDEELNQEYHSKAEYENAINAYGAIYKIVNFSDTKDVATLTKYAKEWIRQNYYDGVLSFTAKAVDLHLLGYDKDKFLCGDRIPVNFLDGVKTPTKKTLTCMSASYDLLKPDNSQFKIGVPDVAANVKWRESVANSTSSGNRSKKTTTDTNVEDKIEEVLVDNGIVISRTETPA